MSRSGEWYPIRTDNYTNMLTDVLSKFRAELELAVKPLEERMNALEAALKGEPAEEKKEGEGIGEGEEKVRTQEFINVYVAALAARRAIYGYAMFLESMGLPKEQKEVVRRIEQLITMVIRLQQTIAMAELALIALESGHPYLGLFRAITAGGTALASFTYGSRSMGG